MVITSQRCYGTILTTLFYQRKKVRGKMESRLNFSCHVRNGRKNAGGCKISALSAHYSRLSRSARDEAYMTVPPTFLLTQRSSVRDEFAFEELTGKVHMLFL